MEYFRTHVAFLYRSTASVNGHVLSVVVAFANLDLAADEDRQDRIDALGHTDPSPLFTWLRDNDACYEGLSIVGPLVDYETLDRVLACRLDYARWYEDVLRYCDDAPERDDAPDPGY